MEIDRAARLRALTLHPSWPELIKVIDEKYQAYTDALSKGLMTTGQLPEDFDYKRGFLAGMRHVTRYPEIANAVLDRELKKKEVASE